MGFANLKQKRIFTPPREERAEQKKPPQTARFPDAIFFHSKKEHHIPIYFFSNSPVKWRCEMRMRRLEISTRSWLMKKEKKRKKKSNKEMHTLTKVVFPVPPSPTNSRVDRIGTRHGLEEGSSIMGGRKGRRR